ncbi:MAG: hypothetical protein O2931_14780, partial [Planctomycetota bacterium]|nr:hypothetical protein [Planctomycetota bacterium]
AIFLGRPQSGAPNRRGSVAKDLQGVFRPFQRIPIGDSICYPLPSGVNAWATLQVLPPVHRDLPTDPARDPYMVTIPRKEAPHADVTRCVSEGTRHPTPM